MFQKRHYEAIAAVIRRLDLLPISIGHVARRFADSFIDNPRFDRDRFLRACYSKLERESDHE